MEKNILEVEGLKTSFKTERGYLKAIDGVSFSVGPGEITGIVGESGCGKSVTMQSLMRLYEEKGNRVIYEGAVKLKGQNLLAIPEAEMKKIRGSRISMIFQDALSALDPVYTIGEQIEETLKLHTKMNESERRKKSEELLKTVGINEPERRLKQYPHELSGGMRQRVMIAIALSCGPELLIADEPTTALDVTIQAQIIDLLLDLNRTLGMSIILITHDMSVVSQICQKVIVMYLGQVVEEADVYSLFDGPEHPYTQGLIRSIPKMEGQRPERLYMIQGTVPLLSQIPRGCRFAPRCPRATDTCRKDMPALEEIRAGHKVRCWHPGRREN
jgi:oligopeptide/dipeptide ABC transporter ATP-binding protein